MFVFELIKKGLRKLSTMPITRTPISEQEDPFQERALNEKKDTWQGPRSGRCPRSGMKEKKAMAVPHRTGE